MGVYTLQANARYLNSQLACRFWIFFFHAFTAIINFAGVVIRSPLSSLAPAALAQIEDAVAQLETLPEGIRAREDLVCKSLSNGTDVQPTLRRVLQQARDAFANQGTGPAPNILGTGQTLVRRSRRRSEASSSTTEHRLPKTLDEAVAVADFLDIFNLEQMDPMSTGQLYDWFNAPGLDEDAAPSMDEEFGACKLMSFRREC